MSTARMFFCNKSLRGLPYLGRQLIEAWKSTQLYGISGLRSGEWAPISVVPLEPR